MTPSLSRKFASLVAVLVLVLVLRTATLAEPRKVEGVIVGRSGSEIIVEYMQGAELAFLLDDSTKVSQTSENLDAVLTPIASSCAKMDPKRPETLDLAVRDNVHRIAQEVRLKERNTEKGPR
jgi:hypothetical protein